MKRISYLILAICLGLGTFPASAFTSAAEVKPILNATKGNWVAVREFDGKDLIYFTHIEAWRCGLDGMSYGINSDTADTERVLEKCYEGEGGPNAMKEEGRLPYIELPLGSVESVTIQLNYDDGTSDSVTFERKAIMTP